MNDPLEALIQAGLINKNLFPPNSRYHGIEISMRENSDGKKIAFLNRRFVPQPERFNLLQEHQVLENERLDNITAHYLSNPEQFWQLCDANRAMWPDELTEEIGRRLRITLPEGIPGAENA